MSIGNSLVRGLGVVGLALLGTACMGDGDQGSFGEDGEAALIKVESPSTEIFEYAPDGEETPAAKEQQDPDLNAKGTSWSKTVDCARTFEEVISLGANQTVTCESSDGTAGVDTVLALLRRNDNGTRPPHQTDSAHYRDLVGTTTVAFNDDIDAARQNRYSRVTYTAGDWAQTLFLKGFAYGTDAAKKGRANVTCTFSNPSNTVDYGTVDFTASSLFYTVCDQGRIRTEGSTDTILLAIDEARNRGTGVWNDDMAGWGSSEITGLTNQSMWFVCDGWGSGSSTIVCEP